MKNVCRVPPAKLCAVRRGSSIFWLLLGIVAYIGIRPAAAQSISLTVAGPPAVIYSTTQSGCGRDFLPDAPARAFKRADGKVALFATSDINWYMLGSSLLSLTSACQTAMVPSDYAPLDDRQLWIEGTYTIDGKNVEALVSEDLTNSARLRGCVPHPAGHCWLSNIVAATSSDMGASFQLVPGASGLIASMADTYDDNFHGRVGYFTTSNVVKSGGYYYFISFAQTDDVKSIGNRLFRTSDITDPSSWRAWDGTGFTAIPRAGASGPPPAVIGKRSLMSEVRSLLWVPKASCWVAVFLGRTRLQGDAAIIPGIYMATSTDLINWGRPSRIFATPLRPTDGVNIVVGYPSILDPGSLTRNFETIDSDRPLLTYTVINPGQPGGIYNREILSVPLRIVQDGP